MNALVSAEPADAVAAGTAPVFKTRAPLRRALQRHAALLPWALALAVVLATPWLPAYYLSLVNRIGLAALSALGLVLLTGVCGMTSFGQAAFIGLGAYAAAFASVGTAGWLGPLVGATWASLPLALGLGVAVSGGLGALTLRLSGHFLPLGTICWALALYAFFGTAEWLGGHTGLSGLPALQLGSLVLDKPAAMTVPIWAALAAAMMLVHWLLDSRGGRALRALNGGQAMAASMGVPVLRMKMAAFTLSALLAVVAGWLYAFEQRFVSPAPFSLGAGIDLLFIALIGGVGQLWGAVAGAIVVTLARDLLQDWLPHLLGARGNYEAIVFGALIMVLMHRAPNGLWGWVRRRWGASAERVLPSPESVSALPRRAMPARGAEVLAARGLTKRFGGLVANRELDLTLHAGEILAVIGPNGAGKSTLFNQLSCVDVPTEGELRLHGARINGWTPGQVARAGLSRTFQHVKLLPTLSVLDNVALGAHLRGHAGLARNALRLDRAEEARLLAEAQRQLERVGLGACAHHEAGSLALGQQRLLEIARALCADPAVLLLDEPAAGLRLQEKQALAALLRQLRDEGMAVLLVEHDMDFVMSLVDRVVVMVFGQKIAEGLPAEVQSNSEVLQAYLGAEP